MPADGDTNNGDYGDLNCTFHTIALDENIHFDFNMSKNI